MWFSRYHLSFISYHTVCKPKPVFTSWKGNYDPSSKFSWNSANICSFLEEHQKYDILNCKALSCVLQRARIRITITVQSRCHCTSCTVEMIKIKVRSVSYLQWDSTHCIWDLSMLWIERLDLRDCDRVRMLKGQTQIPVFSLNQPAGKVYKWPHSLSHREERNV